MVDGTGPENGTSEALTVASAASVFEGLLSGEEDTETPETPPTDETNEELEPTEDTDGGEETPLGDDPDAEVVDEEPETPETPKTRKLKIGDSEVEVTDDELEKGYLRTADYTRKTQALAEQRKAQEAEFTAVRAERQQYATDLVKLSEALGKTAPQEPDWDKLAVENPEEFVSMRQAWDKFTKQRAAVDAEAAAAIAKVQADQQAAHKEMLEAERSKLIEIIPEWVDSSVAKKEMGELSKFAESIGFTKEQVSQVFDHRLVLLLRKASLFDKAEKAKPEVQKKIERVKVATPGSRIEQKPNAKLTQSKKRLAQTGRVQDAAALLEQMLD